MQLYTYLYSLLRPSKAQAPVNPLLNFPTAHHFIATEVVQQIILGAGKDMPNANVPNYSVKGFAVQHEVTHLPNSDNQTVGIIQHKMLKQTLLINGGWSLLHESHYVAGRWNEERRNLTDLETELDFIGFAKCSKDNSLLADIKRIPGISLSLSGPWSENYYHWLIQYLPIIKLIENDISPSDIDHYLVAGPARRFQVESLALLGIPPTKIREVSRRQLAIADNLVVTTIPCANMVFDSKVIGFLRGLSPPIPHKKIRKAIYLDRPAPNQRRAVNEDEVYESLYAYNVEKIDCGSLSFSEQISLSSSAVLMCGIHGASFTNMVFSKRRIGIIECMPRNYNCKWFASLATACGHHYKVLHGAEPGPLPLQKPLQDSDIIIPIKKFRKALAMSYEQCRWN
jgi:hypothetical protein